jgi:pyridoxine 5-phosphate synthase
MILGVNVDHVATVRQARRGEEPDPVMAATLALLGGADGITVHLREDRRHIRDRDLDILREVVKAEMNLEMAATDEMIGIALKTLPHMVTLVPEKREELTTEGGLNLSSHVPYLRDSIRKIHDKGIPVSLFINPNITDVDISKEVGADMVEIHTGLYANSQRAFREGELRKVREAVNRARLNGMDANAGHGLNYINVKPVASIEGIRGLYIGHSIVSRAILVGFEKAVRQMKDLIESAE